MVTQLNILRQLYDLQGRVHLSSAVAQKTFQQFIFDISICAVSMFASPMTSTVMYVIPALYTFEPSDFFQQPFFSSSSKWVINFVVCSTCFFVLQCPSVRPTSLLVKVSFGLRGLGGPFNDFHHRMLCCTNSGNLRAINFFISCMRSV